MKIQFIDLAAQQRLISSGIKKRIETVLDHGQYIMGPEVEELEEKLAEYTEAKHCISCSSGTDALLLALMAYDIGPGDAVITTAFSFIGTAEPIALLGATPVFADIDPKTFNIDPSQISEAIKNAEQKGLKPKGIITVDLFGLAADYGKIMTIAKKEGLFVIDDAAQSFGALYHGKKIGNVADITTTSFYPSKPLGCYGDGGAIFTDSDDLAENLKSIRIHGQGKNQYDNIRLGINGRMDTLQASILLEKLSIFDEELDRRNEAASYYSKELERLVEIQSIPENCRSSWALYSVFSERREEIRKSLSDNGIPTSVYYPKPLHLQPAFSSLGYSEGEFPESERLSCGIFSIPMHPYLKPEETKWVVKHLKKAVGKQ